MSRYRLTVYTLQFAGLILTKSWPGPNDHTDHSMVFHGSEGNFNCFDTSSPLVPLKIVPLFALRWINVLRSFIIDCRPFLLAVLFLISGGNPAQKEIATIYFYLVC